jgi:hypothetical protein
MEGEAYDSVDEWLDIFLGCVQANPDCSHHDCQSWNLCQLRRIEDSLGDKWYTHVHDNADPVGYDIAIAFDE